MDVDESASRSRTWSDPFKFVDQGETDGRSLDITESSQTDESQNSNRNIEEDSTPRTEVESSYILIYQASSFDDVGGTDSDNSEVWSQLKRGRGSGYVRQLDQDSSNVDGQEVMEFSETHLESQSGYVMRFVGEQYTDLTIFDILSIPDLSSYPLSRETLDSIPSGAYGKLNEQGYIKCSGVYDKSSQQFYSFEIGWENSSKKQADILASLLDEDDDGRITRFIYYFLYEYASDEYSTYESIAEIRDIQPSTVETEIHKARDSIDSSFFPQ